MSVSSGCLEQCNSPKATAVARLATAATRVEQALYGMYIGMSIVCAIATLLTASSVGHQMADKVIAKVGRCKAAPNLASQ